MTILDASKSPVFLRQPPELLARIFDEVKTIGGLASIKACSLVCSHFVAYTRPRLVSGSKLRLTSVDECVRALRLARFAPLVYQHFDALVIWDKLPVDDRKDPYLDGAEQMRVLGRTVSDLDRETVTKDIAYVQWSTLGCLKDLLAPLTRIKTLSVEWMPPQSQILNSSAREELLRIAKDVEALAIRRSEFTDARALVDFIRLFPNIASLRCESIAAGEPEHPVPSSLLHLRHVFLTSVVHTNALFGAITEVLDTADLKSLAFNYDPKQPDASLILHRSLSRLHPNEITLIYPALPEHDSFIADVCVLSASLDILRTDHRMYLGGPPITPIVHAAASNSRTLRMLNPILPFPNQAEEIIAAIRDASSLLSNPDGALACVCIASPSQAIDLSRVELLDRLARLWDELPVTSSPHLSHDDDKHLKAYRVASPTSSADAPTSQIVCALEIKRGRYGVLLCRQIAVYRDHPGALEECMRVMEPCFAPEENPSTWEINVTYGALMPGHTLLKAIFRPKLLPLPEDLPVLALFEPIHRERLGMDDYDYDSDSDYDYGSDYDYDE